MRLGSLSIFFRIFIAVRAFLMSDSPTKAQFIKKPKKDSIRMPQSSGESKIHSAAEIVTKAAHSVIEVSGWECIILMSSDAAVQSLIDESDLQRGPGRVLFSKEKKKLGDCVRPDG
jgi:hypothetical protein